MRGFLALQSSTLATAGREAALIADAFWWMAAGALVIWVALLAVLFVCLRGGRPGSVTGSARWLILGGGVVLPVLVLSVLMVTTLPLLAVRGRALSPAGLRVAVSGEQWWWRVRYLRSGEEVEVANELRLPVGAEIDVELASDNVIHAFWVPSLAGKMDVIPGRTTVLRLQPTRLGEYKGLCAEYCGASHARMALTVAVVSEPEFEEWIGRQSSPAARPGTDEGREGLAAFTSSGCGACHAVRGTSAAGRIGPDLTHFASRPTLAGVTDNEDAPVVDWLRRPSHLKPGARMPGFHALGEPNLRAIAAYLRELR